MVTSSDTILCIITPNHNQSSYHPMHCSQSCDHPMGHNTIITRLDINLWVIKPNLNQSCYHPSLAIILQVVTSLDIIQQVITSNCNQSCYHPMVCNTYPELVQISTYGSEHLITDPNILWVMTRPDIILWVTTPSPNQSRQKDLIITNLDVILQVRTLQSQWVIISIYGQNT